MVLYAKLYILYQYRDRMSLKWTLPNLENHNDCTSFQPISRDVLFVDENKLQISLYEMCVLNFHRYCCDWW